MHEKILTKTKTLTYSEEKNKDFSHVIVYKYDSK